jgi:hypothetical protein
MPEWFSLEDRKSYVERAFTDLHRQIEKARVFVEKCNETAQGVDKAVVKVGWVVEAEDLENVHAISKY